jgi:hypothetical protein
MYLPFPLDFLLIWSLCIILENHSYTRLYLEEAEKN